MAEASTSRQTQYDLQTGERPTAVGAPTPFAEFGNKYKEEVQLGSGGFAVVKLAIDKQTGAEAASKTITFRHQTTEKKASNYDRTMEELKIFYSLQGKDLKSGHCHIIRLLNWYMDIGNSIILLFERLYDTLHDRLEAERQKNNHNVSEEDARPIIKQLTRAVKYLHDRNISHRDVKTQNILCEQPEGLIPIKLCDFNVSKYADKTPLSPMKTAIGTALWFDPQRADRVLSGEDIGYGRKCDIWAIGAVLHEVFFLCPIYSESSQCGYPNCPNIRQNVYDFKYFYRCRRCVQKSLEARACSDFDASARSSPFRNHSDLCKDFVERCLKLEEADRANADQLLDHQWLSPNKLKHRFQSLLCTQ